jgi:hypothetical protein
VRELPGELGREQEAGAAPCVVGLSGLDLLECHLAVQLAVERHTHHADAAAGVRAQDAKAGARRREFAGFPRGRCLEVRCCVLESIRCRQSAGAGRETIQSQAQAGAIGLEQPDGGERPRFDGSQAFLGVVAVLLQVQSHEPLQHPATLLRESATVDEHSG